MAKKPSVQRIKKVKRDLWSGITDISSGSLNSGVYGFHKNNGAFVMPSGLEGDARGGCVFQFAGGPVQGELTGPAFTPTAGRSSWASSTPAKRVKTPTSRPARGPAVTNPSPPSSPITGFA